MSSPSLCHCSDTQTGFYQTNMIWIRSAWWYVKYVSMKYFCSISFNNLNTLHHVEFEPNKKSTHGYCDLTIIAPSLKLFLVKINGLMQTNDVHTNMFFVKVPWHWIIVELSWSRALWRFEGNSIKVKFDGIYKINTQRDWVSGNSILFFMCWAIIPNMEELQFLNATTHIGFDLMLAEDWYNP